MATPFSSIYSYFLNNNIQDYELQQEFISSPTTADARLQGWLIKSTTVFGDCVKNLNSVDLANSQFNVDLDTEEVIILAEIMTLCWYEYQNNNLLVLLSPLQDTDYKFSNHYQAYVAGLSASNMQREKINNYITNYCSKHYPLSNYI